MSILRASTVRKIFKSKPEYRRIKVFIETGTYLAKSVRNIRSLFHELHTIELSRKLYKTAKNRYGSLGIHFHFGDSADLLPIIADAINGPIFFYLDAHGFDKPQVISNFPIWRELDYIKTRPYADIIVIDDLASFGQKDSNPRVEFGWTELHPKAIIDHLGRERQAGRMTENNSLILFRKRIKK